MRTGIDDQETVVPLGVGRDSAGMARALKHDGTEFLAHMVRREDDIPTLNSVPDNTCLG